MNEGVILAILQALEQRLLDGLEKAKAAIPGTLDDAAIDAIEQIIKDAVGSIDVKLLESSATAAVVALLAGGKAPAGSHPVDFAG